MVERNNQSIGQRYADCGPWSDDKPDDSRKYGNRERVQAEPNQYIPHPVRGRLEDHSHQPGIPPQEGYYATEGYYEEDGVYYDEYGQPYLEGYENMAYTPEDQGEDGYEECQTDPHLYEEVGQRGERAHYSTFLGGFSGNEDHQPVQHQRQQIQVCHLFF